MARILFQFCVILLLSKAGHAQDFSNKGNDFWVGYGYHVMMNAGNGGGSQEMVLYFATEAVTNVTVSIPGLGYSVTYPNISANAVFTSGALPKAGTIDARLLGEGISSKGVHITSDKPIVAYAHIYNGDVSGATLLFPTATLGKEYYSVNYTQVSNQPQSNGWVYAVAVDTGTTVVEITPAANTLNHRTGIPFTVSLKQGEIINLLGQLSNRNEQPYTGEDLTGTIIKSIGTGTGSCKRIAVFSGSGKLSITCDPSSGSSDNYMVQAFPKTAWGKKYLTVPTKDLANNFFRICVSDPSTVVKMNGAVLGGLKNNFYYEINTTTPVLVEGDKPLLVAQYITSQGYCGNAEALGDPEVIYLSPVEQNIDRVILNSTPNSSIKKHYINVVIKTAALPSFRVDGNLVFGFIPHPQDPAYSYAQLSVDSGKHTLRADSGFNAIAYGYGAFESYGFNAGTNVKDLYQFVSIQNQYATVNFPAACKTSPFYFNMTFPFQPTQIKWLFGPALNALGLADVTLGAPVYDSTWTVNGKQLYRYRLPTAYNVGTTGTFPIRILTQNPTTEGCSGEQEINYDLQVYDRPSASLAYVSSGCISDSIHFSDNSNLAGRTATRWSWNFGDAMASLEQNPAHLYQSAGAFPVRFSLISDIGCVSDTAGETIVITEPPVAKFGVAATACAGKAIQFSDLSSTTGSALLEWVWNFGDNTPNVVASTGVAQTHTYAMPGNYKVSLQVKSASGCRSLVFIKDVTISAGPIADFSFGEACLPTGSVQFTNQSSIQDGTAGQLLYRWDFGDGGTSTAKDPVHNFKTAGPFAAKLAVTSSNGCADSTLKNVTTVYEAPVAKFTGLTESCLGAALNFTDASTAANSALALWEWNFGDGSAVVADQSPQHTYAQAGTYTVTLLVRSANGCVSAPGTQNVVINALPIADFDVASSACENSNAAFTNLSSAGTNAIAKATWGFGDGATSDLLSPTHIYQLAGNYSVLLAVETDKGCKSLSVSKQITVHPTPKVGFAVPGTCVNDPSTTFVDGSSIGDDSQADLQWLWNFGDLNASPANNSSTAKDGQHKYTEAGEYNVSLTVTSKEGCASSLTQTLIVNGAVPVPSFLFTNGGPLCSGSPVAVTDNSFVSPGNLVKVEIYWDYNTDPTNKTTVINPVRGASYTHLYPTLFTPAAKDYSVKFVIYSGQSCLAEKDTIIAVLAMPEIQFNAPDPACADAPSFLLTAGVINTTGGNGSFTGNGITANGVFNPADAGAGFHLIRYSYRGTNECTGEKEQTVLVRPVPVVSAGPDKAILEGGSAPLNGESSGTGLQYQWSPSAGLSSATVLRPVASPAADVIYTLVVTSADGCAASDAVLVKVLKTPVVPNAFSPNGDGVHDKWQIDFLDSYPNATIEIFNRYGQKVFESKGYAKPWDGTLNGKSLPVGTYYYIIDPKNGRKPIAGFVDIIR